MQRDPPFKRLAEQAIERCRIIAGFSETSGAITRTFLSKPMRDCHAAVSGWMNQLGMAVVVDAAGDIRGLCQAKESSRRLLMGSHLDTVPEAGAYDGVLGVCIALAIVEALQDRRLPFDVEVIGFSEEEGVRFGVPFLGSLAAVGRFGETMMQLQDAHGCTVREAILQFGLDPERMPDARVDTRAFAYLEFHIEQGPVLDSAGESIAAVSAIAGQTRLEFSFTGRANHAGTTPMELRRDALAGAAEWISAVEQHARSTEGLVATVGSVHVSPGAGNIIPGQVRASLDVRHWSDEERTAAVRALCEQAKQIASRRILQAEVRERMNQRAVMMDEHLVNRIEQGMRSMGEPARRMVSGAGHDAMIMAEQVPSAMVFLRSPGGISHHAEESVRADDVEKGIRLGVAILTDFAAEMN